MQNDVQLIHLFHYFLYDHGHTPENLQRLMEHFIIDDLVCFLEVFLKILNENK